MASQCSAMKQLLLLLSLSVLVACGSSTARRQVKSVAGGEQSMELPLPALPADLRVPAERAAYVLLHFWDAMEFEDTLRSCNRGFMEQNISNFLSLFPHATTASVPQAVGNLLKRAAASPEAFALVNRLLESYLDDSDSPMRSWEYYVVYLREYLRLPSITASQSARAGHNLKIAMHNAPGTAAPDFTFTARDGKSSSLYASAAGKECLLVFYDPDCEHCMETVEALRKNTVLNSRIAAGKTVVVAIYPMGDTLYWDKTKTAMPSNWVVGCDYGAVVRGSLYLFKSLPALFLLDKDGVVLQKEPSILQLETLFGD